MYFEIDKDEAKPTMTSTTTNSSSANSVTNDMLQTAKQTLAALHVQRQALESEASAITSELTAPLESGGPPMGIDTPLVDDEGYPRADIDVYRARTLRGRLATIRTDHAQITRDMDAGLQRVALLQNPAKAEQEQAELAARRAPKPKPKYDPVSGKWVVKNWDGTLAGAPQGEARSFETLQSTTPTSNNATTTNAATFRNNNNNSASLRPFAKINSVADRSPAAAAGLQPDDLVLRFGNITLHDEDFAQLAKLVPDAAASQTAIAVVVQRQSNSSNVTLQLQPRPWEGRGLLGCHIVPFQG